MGTEIMFNMRSTALQVPDNLNVTGRGLSPSRPRSPPSPEDTAMLSMANSSQTSLSEDDVDNASEEYTVLDGVREMNQILVRQIETLRLKIKVDEKNYDQDKARLLKSKENELRTKESEIEELRESVNARDDAIDRLTRAGEEKERTIQTKCAEIEELKGMVRQTKEYAQKMQKQVGLARQRREKLEADPLYQQQNEEISKLTQELETLRGRLATMENELSRALTIIDQQNEKLESLDEERAALHEKFREDLDRASKAMRQEVERMREVMRQNYDEMRNLREQNREIHGDVRAIKEMLSASKASPRAHPHDQYQESLRPITANPYPAPSYGRHIHGQPTVVAPKGPGRMVGGSMSRNPASENRRAYNGVAANPAMRESTQFGAKANASVAAEMRGASARGHLHVDSSGYYSSSSTARLSPETNRSRIANSKMSLAQAANNNNNNNNVPQNKNNASVPNGDGKTLPAICSLKEGVIPQTRQPSGRGRVAVRKGSAVTKK